MNAIRKESVYFDQLHQVNKVVALVKFRKEKGAKDGDDRAKANQQGFFSFRMAPMIVVTFRFGSDFFVSCRVRASPLMPPKASELDQRLDFVDLMELVEINVFFWDCIRLLQILVLSMLLCAEQAKDPRYDACF